MRRPDWVERLHDVIEQARTGKLTFDYGTMNCALFAARCLDAVHEGASYEDELRTYFTDEASARAWVKLGGGVERLVGARLGQNVPWWLCRRGDVATVDTAEGPAVGICTGEHIAALSPTGVAFVRLERALHCWKVD